jgi:hypothetical protein
MRWLRRFLDPPELVERNRQIQAGVLPRPPGLTVTEVGFAVPLGCMVPLAIGAAVLVGAGVLAGTRLQAAAVPPDRVTVRVLDDGAAGGPKVLSTQVVPLRR